MVARVADDSQSDGANEVAQMRLVEWLHARGMTKTDFARCLSERMGTNVSAQNVWRWTRDTDHDDYGVPSPETVVAIYFLTNKGVTIESWYAHMLKAKPSRKGRVAA
jgi:hypothetical protein